MRLDLLEPLLLCTNMLPRMRKLEERRKRNRDRDLREELQQVRAPRIACEDF